MATAREWGRTALEEVPGVRILTPATGVAGLLTFVIDGRDPQEACAALAARGVVIRWLERPAALRASFGFFCDEVDVQRLSEGVNAVARGDW